jgi:uncharacterized protein (TIGR02444 family)
MSADTEFWNFSLAVYARDGVPAECLYLQDTHRIDVNLLLFCAWLGARGTVLSSSDIAAAAKAVSPWQANIIGKIREVRRALKQLDAETLRGKIKAAELDAERIEQTMLTQWAVTTLGGRPSSPDALQMNIQALFTFYKITDSVPAHLLQAAETTAPNN